MRCPDYFKEDDRKVFRQPIQRSPPPFSDGTCHFSRNGSIRLELQSLKDLMSYKQLLEF